MMRQRLAGRFFLGIALLLVVALVAAACGGDDDEDEAAAPVPVATEPVEAAAAVEPAEPVSEEEVMVERGTLRHVHNHQWGGQESMDPAAPTSFQEPVQWVYDRLVRLDFDGKPAPELATSFAVDSTLQKWTFNLEEGVTFSDGSAFTAEDVIYSFEHQLDPNVGSQLGSVLAIIDADNFETPDPYTLVVNLNQGHADFPLLLRHYAMRIISADASAETLRVSGLGTGPFVTEVLEVDGVSVFNSRDDYWQRLPGVERITEVGISDSDARVQALLAGQTDFQRLLTPPQASLFEGNPNFVIQENSTGLIQNLAMIVTEPPFDDARVRKALKLVVDADEMIEVAVQGHGNRACNNPVWPVDQYYLLQDCPQDIDAAKALLAEAGYADGLTIELATSQLSPQWIPIATVYREQAALAGVTVEINQVPSDGYWSDVWMVHPFLHSNWTLQSADSFMSMVFRCGADWGENFWCNDDFEQTLDAAQAEPDFDRRKALYHQVQMIQVEDGGMIAPFFQTGLRVLSARVKGMEPEHMGFEFPWHEFSIEKP